jgi:hypothetical protein
MVKVRSFEQSNWKDRSNDKTTSAVGRSKRLASWFGCLWCVAECVSKHKLLLKVTKLVLSLSYLLWSWSVSSRLDDTWTKLSTRDSSTACRACRWCLSRHQDICRDSDTRHDMSQTCATKLDRGRTTLHHIVKHHCRAHCCGILFNAAMNRFSFVTLHSPHELLKLMRQKETHHSPGVKFRVARARVHCYCEERNAKTADAAVPAAAWFINLPWIFDSQLGDLIKRNLKTKTVEVGSWIIVRESPRGSWGYLPFDFVCWQKCMHPNNAVLPLFQGH